MLLVDERPEEVTDFRRTFADPGATAAASGVALAAEMLGSTPERVAPSPLAMR